MKSLEDDYKKVKDHNGRSGNNRETCDYFEEVDAVLDCKPNITPKYVVDFGLEDSMEGESTSSNGKDYVAYDEPLDDEEESAKEHTKKQGKGKRKPPVKGKQPAKKHKRRSATIDDSTQDLFDFLQTSQEKGHEFFGRLAEKEAERDLKSQKRMFDTIKEIAKIYKDN